MAEMVTANYPARFADSLGLTSYVVPSRDFFATHLNYFVAIHRWQFDSVLRLRVTVGALSTKSLDFVDPGPTRLVGGQAISQYLHLMKVDSLWTYVAETPFWNSGPEIWEREIEELSWMYVGKRQPLSSRRTIRLLTSDFADTSMSLNRWRYVVGRLVSSNAWNLLRVYTDSSTILVYDAWARGQDFASLFGTRDGLHYLCQGIAGINFTDSIVYRKLWANPRKLSVDVVDRLARADSVWVLIDSADLRLEPQFARQLYFKASQNYERERSDVFILQRDSPEVSFR